MKFFKYQGTGNDFILIDNRKNEWNFTRAQISEFCNRRFGIGGDGFILLNSHSTLDFEMKNYNSDGGECSMCGNGGRALIQFANDLGLVKDHYRFLAIDGIHEAFFKNSLVELKMKAVTEIIKTTVGFSLDTGSPHLVIEARDLLNLDVVREGRKIRNSSLFMPSGINVNFIEQDLDQLFIRTYERGVEDETLSCGTGAIASAIVSTLPKHLPVGAFCTVPIQCQGGKLTIRFQKKAENYYDEIWLVGPAKKTFEGTL